MAGHPWVGGRLGAVGVSPRLRSKWRLRRHTAGWEWGARPANKALLLCLLPAAPRPASLPWIVRAFSLLQLFTGSARRGHARTVVALSWVGRAPNVVPLAGLGGTLGAPWHRPPPPPPPPLGFWAWGDLGSLAVLTFQSLDRAVVLGQPPDCPSRSARLRNDGTAELCISFCKPQPLSWCTATWGLSGLLGNGKPQPSPPGVRCLHVGHPRGGAEGRFGSRTWLWSS